MHLMADKTVYLLYIVAPGTANLPCIWYKYSPTVCYLSKTFVRHVCFLSTVYNVLKTPHITTLIQLYCEVISLHLMAAFHDEFYDGVST